MAVKDLGGSRGVGAVARGVSSASFAPCPAPDGTEVCRIPIPEVPANCCFGGKDFTTLSVTARSSLYAVDVGIEGVRRAR